MTLDEVPEVTINLLLPDPWYIVAELKDAGGKVKIVVYSSNRISHRGLLEEVEQMVRDLEVKARCLGGGFLEIKPEKKTLKVYGESRKYGKEKNCQETVRMIQKAHPDFKVWEG